MKIFYRTLLLAIIFGCNHSGNEEYGLRADGTYSLKESFKSKIKLEGSIIGDSTFLGNPFWILSLDTLLISMQMGGSDFLNIYDLKNKRNVGDYGKIGRGPGEFASPFSLEKLSSRSIGIYDLNRRTYYRLNIDSLISNSDYEPSKLFDLKNVETTCFLVLPLNKNEFISTGNYPDGKYAHFSNYNLKAYLSDYPEDGHEIGNAAKAMIYQGRLIKHPSDETFIYFNISSPIFEILRRDKSGFRRSIQKIFDFPDYLSKNRNYPIKKRENKKGFISGAVSNEHIYLLYSGKDYETYGLDYSTGNKIYVFDWEGKPVKYYETKEELGCISVDEHEETIYAIMQDPDPKYIRYRL